MLLPTESVGKSAQTSSPPFTIPFPKGTHMNQESEVPLKINLTEKLLPTPHAISPSACTQKLGDITLTTLA